MSLPRRTVVTAAAGASTPGAPAGRQPGRQRLHPHSRGYGMADSDYPVEDLPTPDPSYGAERVVGIQLDALGSNDDPIPNAGIGTAYNFASPANRRQTGPFDRFVRMVEGPRYAPMIDHVEAVRGPLERDGRQARQTITLTGPDGRTATYEFGVSKRSGGRFDGCWLTDYVRVV